MRVRTNTPSGAGIESSVSRVAVFGSRYPGLYQWHADRPARRLVQSAASRSPRHQPVRHSKRLESSTGYGGLVTPGNREGQWRVRELEERAQAGRRMAADPRIDVTCLESVIGTRYNCRHDNLPAPPRFRPAALYGLWALTISRNASLAAWQRITTQVPIAVIDRPPQSLPRADGARRPGLARYRCREMRQAGGRPPSAGLGVPHRPKLNLSSTGLRNPDGSWRPRGEKNRHEWQFVYGTGILKPLTPHA